MYSQRRKGRPRINWINEEPKKKKSLIENTALKEKVIRVK